MRNPSKYGVVRLSQTDLPLHIGATTPTSDADKPRNSAKHIAVYTEYSVWSSHFSEKNSNLDNQCKEASRVKMKIVFYYLSNSLRTTKFTSTNFFLPGFAKPLPFLRTSVRRSERLHTLSDPIPTQA